MDGNIEEQREFWRMCAGCGVKMDAARFHFQLCTRCALDKLRNDVDVLRWREERKRKAYERLAIMRTHKRMERRA